MYKSSSPSISMTKKCEMKLLGITGSPFVTRVEFVLKLKSIEYEYFEEDLLNKSELLVTSNPVFRRVPVLLHANKQPMAESLPIMEYLDELKPDVHPLLPSDPSDRVQCRVLAYTFDTLCVPWIKEFMLTREKERKEELKTLLIEGFVMLEEAFVKLSKGKAFFCGDDIGYLDIVVGSCLGWIKLYGIVFDFNVIEEDRNPRLAEWGKNMWSHEVAKNVIPSHEIHMKFLNMLLDMFPPLPVSTNDAITGVMYWNLFDVMVDVVIASLMISGLSSPIWRVQLSSWMGEGWSTLKMNQGQFQARGSGGGESMKNEDVGPIMYLMYCDRKVR
ncbi:hypothetical protein L1987_16788 [Smallanthus sonchifolius]|uniref:Uncharacterized protein n=1 Tax=Smallanthus sonchifolius TaxID=185202 RepID=A0ACB9IVL9_9ASTR|nr:hypothetical protein L1987_16788 [Smallanthus sonchifolius]